MAKILVVDDTPHMQLQLKALLEAGGFIELVFAKNAVEAFHLLGLNNEKIFPAGSN